MGTRLRQAVPDLPKPMAPVAGRPFLCFVLDDLAAQGVGRCVLSVGYRREAVMDYFSGGYRGMELVYSVEERPLKTGGAIRQALSLCKEEPFVLNGDTFFPVSLAEMAAYHERKGARLTVALKKMERFDRYGEVECDARGAIRHIWEKRPCASGFVNGGVYRMSRELLAGDWPQSFSFEEEVLEKTAPGARFYGFISDAYFIDIGVREDYEKASRELRPHKAVLIDRDGTINVDTGHLCRPEDLELLPDTARGIRELNLHGYLVIVVTNQAGVAKGLYGEEDVRRLHEAMNERLREEYGAHIDAFYYCPHHPESQIEEYGALCGCRKPKAGMLLRAMREWLIRPERSYMIGDQPWDLEAGRAAGVKPFRYQNNMNEILKKIAQEDPEWQSGH